MSDEHSIPTAPPVLRVLTPDATAEEVAALVAVFAALGSRRRPPAAPARSEWAAPSRLQRVVSAPGPGAWRASGLPS